MNFANINHCWGSLMIEELVRQGADYFCVAPGSRSSALVIAVAQHKKVKSIVHFDERGLAFHAMGYAAATHKPAVLICTSGTAAANFLPAIIEAAKKKLPLIVITADRPPELRQTGAVQTIDQVGLFGKYVAWAADIPCPDLKIDPSYVLTTIDQAVYQAKRNKAPVHLNCMFRQPLSLTKTSDDLTQYLIPISRWLKSTKPFTAYIATTPSTQLTHPKAIADTINQIKSAVIVVGKISGKEEAQAVLDFAQKLGWPIFGDIASGLRLGHDHSHVIHYFDQLLAIDALKEKLSFDGVVHLGGRMTSARYYEFIQKQNPQHYIMVLNHALRNDPNHQVTLRVESSVSAFIQSIQGEVKARKSSAALKLLSNANKTADKITDQIFLADEKVNEPAIARVVSQIIPADHGLFLSNSMPIRDMGNFAVIKGKAVAINGNRGASGIDGIIASAAGYAQGLKAPVTLMIGDLAALHDLNSLAILRDLPVPLVIVLINNGGGAIFSFLPIAEFKEGFEKFWGTPHGYTLASAAAMFELNYCQPMDMTHFKKSYNLALKQSTSTIIEVMTSRTENLKIHKSFQESLERHLS